jgi:hypothetical protein
MFNVLKTSSLKRLKACRKKIILNALIYFANVKDKIFFLQMACFSNYCKQYFRINFADKFNLQYFSIEMIEVCNACIPLSTFNSIFLVENMKI